MSTYSLHADFENIDSPELIAASLSILQKEDWTIKDYNAIFLNTERNTVNNQKTELTLSISKNEVTIECTSDLAEQANQFIVESFTQNLHKFILAPSFDHQVRNLKHHYFMDNPLQNVEEESTQSSNSSVANTVFSFRKNFRVTPALILMNAAVFIGMVVMGVSIMNPSTLDILNWGGNFRSFVLQGQWWRLITCCFIHIGIIHILFNMWALYSIGVFLERMIGSWRFGFAYVIAGLAGSLNSIVWHYATPSAGASGAIFGMFGLFLALLTTNILEKGFRKAMLQSIVPMILFNLLLGTSAMIDNAGHIGGLIAGLICGYLYAWHYKYPRNKAINCLAFVLPLLLIVGSGFIISKKLPDTFATYEKILKTVSEMENKALLLEEQSIYDSAATLKLWDTSILEINKAQKLKLNEDLEARNEMLFFYLQKRRQQAILLNNKPANEVGLKQAQQSVDSILKILNEKEE
ncbi:MAG: rhomboid family intramembrane serine protease [Bacteroidia bacterium]